MLRIVTLAALAVVPVLLAGVLVLAPQLPALLSEGFPKPVWPAPGRFAEVGGAAAEPLPAAEPRKALHPWLHGMFGESGGRALVIVHKGVMTHEHYAAGITPATRLNSYSMAKSLVGALVLRAVAEGRIESLDTAVGLFVSGLDPSLARAPLRSVLEMRSGVSLETSFGGKDADDRANPFGGLARLHALGLEAVKAGLRGAGDRTAFRYQNVNTALLGAALERIYGMSLPALLDEKIWRPAGAGLAYWRKYSAAETVSPYCCLYATARDWAKVGLFLMRNSTPAAPFLPQGLWRLFFGETLEDAAVARGHYGLHVRHDVLDRAGEPLHGRFTLFHGQGGQMLYLMPERDLIVVRFGEREQLVHSTLYAAWRSLPPE